MWPGLAAWAIVAWLVFAPAPARAQFGMDTARVIVLEGRVSVERLGELWILQAGQTVRGGQVVVTGPDGYAQMELSDHSLVEVFANSRLVFRASPFNFRDLIDLYLGRIKLQIQHLTGGDSPYRVTTPTAVISIRGTVLNVDVGPTEETIVHVEEGSVGVRHRLMPGREISVETGETIQVLPNVPLAALPGRLLWRLRVRSCAPPERRPSASARQPPNRAATREARLQAPPRDRPPPAAIPARTKRPPSWRGQIRRPSRRRHPLILPWSF